MTTPVAASLNRKQQELLVQLLDSGISREKLASVLQSGSQDEWAEFRKRTCADSSSLQVRSVDQKSFCREAQGSSASSMITGPGSRIVPG